MRRMLLLILVVLWAAGLVAYSTWPRPKQFDRFASLNRTQLDQKGVFRDYSIGAQAFGEKVPAGKACSDLNGATKSACMQGYMVAEIREMLREFSAHSQDTSFLKIPDWTMTKPEFRVLWYASLGMALDQMGVDARVAKEYVKNDGLFKYVVDGWAFGHSLLNGLRSTLQNCSAHHQEQMSACLFGAGRGAFFLPQQLAELNEIPQNIKDGYSYSQAFNSADPSDEGFRTESGQAGRKMLALWNGVSSMPTAKTKWLECVSQKHIVDCKSQF